MAQASGSAPFFYLLYKIRTSDINDLERQSYGVPSGAPFLQTRLLVERRSPKKLLTPVIMSAIITVKQIIYITRW